LTKFNLPGVGRQEKVDVEGTPGYENTTLIWEPCGHLMCPKGAHCHGVEDASVWLCETIKDDITLCTGYGVMEQKNVSIEFWDGYSISSGLRVRYQGYGRNEVSFHLWCDQELRWDDLVLPNYVRIMNWNEQLVVDPVTMRAVCPGLSPTETPMRPTKTPMRPTSSARPTPTSRISPSPPQRSHKINGGSAFLLAVAIVFLGYSVGGLAIKSICLADMAYPNSEFWLEFGYCVLAAVVWIFSCGKRIDMGQRGYETM
jgi:hypothetical protein